MTIERKIRIMHKVNKKLKKKILTHALKFNSLWKFKASLIFSY